MAHLEVVTRSQYASIPVLSGTPDFYYAFEKIVGVGTHRPFDNVALINVPERTEWRTEEEGTDAELFSLGSLALSAKPKDLAKNMEEPGNSSFRRISNLISSYYVAAPAKGRSLITLGLDNAVCFDGAELISALSDCQIPMEIIDNPTLEPPYGAYAEKYLGGFLLDLAGIKRSR